MLGFSSSGRLDCRRSRSVVRKRLPDRARQRRRRAREDNTLLPNLTDTVRNITIYVRTGKTNSGLPSCNSFPIQNHAAKKKFAVSLKSFSGIPTGKIFADSRRKQPPRFHRPVGMYGLSIAATRKKRPDNAECFGMSATDGTGLHQLQYRKAARALLL